MEENRKKDYLWLGFAFIFAFIAYIIFICSNVDYMNRIIMYRRYGTSLQNLYINLRGTSIELLRNELLRYIFIFFGLGIVSPVIRNFIPRLKNQNIPNWKYFYVPYDLILIIFFLFSEPISRFLVSVLDSISGYPLNITISEIVFHGAIHGRENYPQYITFIYFVPVAVIWIFFYLFGNEIACIKDIGVLNFLKNRSIIIRLIRFITNSWSTFEYEIIHYDFTKKNFKIILKTLVVNFFVLVLIYYLGNYYNLNPLVIILLFVVYSMFLVIVCSYFILHIRAKYTSLFDATQKLAEGKMTFNTSEDWGSFEPIKAELNSVSENVREALEKELKSQRLKTELITNVSHDLKTPLTTIITYVDLLKDPNITREQREEYVQLLDRKSQQLKVLIEDLFEVSKAVSKNIKPELREVDIIHLLKQVVFELENTFAEKNLSIRYKLADEKQILMLDSQRTFRIFENLLVNASKYSLNGTRVYIETRSADDMYEILVKNITADELTSGPDELTERFVRGDQSRNSEGSGLGLAIAKSFAELQGGSLNIEIDGDLFKVITAFPLLNETEKDI